MPYTILLADDSVTIRKVVELMFGDTDIRVESAAGGREAVEKFHALKPDLVLADVIMPPPSGYELCSVVKGSDNPVPVLLLAGAFEPYDEAMARECLADGHLVKPFESEYLIHRVTELLSTASFAKRTAQLGEDARPGDSEAVGGEDPMPIPVEFESDSGISVVVEQADDQVTDATRTFHEVGDPLEETPVGEDVRVGPLAKEDLDRIAEFVVARLSEEVVREIAWEVVPDLAETLVRERIRQLEDDDLPARER